MKKLLIADRNQTLMQAISRQLKEDFSIRSCSDGEQVLACTRSFQPDMILLDLHLPKIDGLDVLRTLRSAGIAAKVIVTGSLENDWICHQLEQLQVVQYFARPYHTQMVASRMRELSLEPFISQTVEQATNHLLLSLGFRMGLARYQCTYLSLLMKLQGEGGGVTKCLYPQVAKAIGGNSQQVEKAIRDGIQDAFRHGNREIWQMYFPTGANGASQCPSNEVFLARMAYAVSLLTGETFRKAQ